jgi:hypothetical protein
MTQAKRSFTAYQRNRRDKARERGDCTTCCKRPAKPGRARCAYCDDYQRTIQGWQGGERKRRAFIEVRGLVTLVACVASFELGAV